MMLLARAIVTGFGLTLGAALFKKHVAKRLGLEEEPTAKKDEALEQDGGTDPSLQDK